MDLLNMFKKWSLWLLILSILCPLKIKLNVLQKLEIRPNSTEAVEDSKKRYDDFYKRQKELKKEEGLREQGRDLYIKNKKKEAERLEKIESQYAKAKKDIDQEKLDRIAEQWMEKQEKKHEESLERAKETYVSSKKKAQKYKIPESEEYEVK